MAQKNASWEVSKTGKSICQLHHSNPPKSLIIAFGNFRGGVFPHQ